jgi:hypothetical protein
MSYKIGLFERWVEWLERPVNIRGGVTEERSVFGLEVYVRTQTTNVHQPGSIEEVSNFPHQPRGRDNAVLVHDEGQHGVKPGRDM